MKRIVGVVLLLTAWFVTDASAAQALKELRISAIPDENPQEMLRIYQPFADYLSKEIGIPVKFTPVVDYAATVEGLAANRLEMVWYGGLTSVQAARQAKGARRIIMRKEDAQFKSHFVTRKETGIKNLKDLKGKTFAFGSVSSTSGHLMPRYFLIKGESIRRKIFQNLASAVPTMRRLPGLRRARSMPVRSISWFGTSWLKPKRWIPARLGFSGPRRLMSITSGRCARGSKRRRWRKLTKLS